MASKDNNNKYLVSVSNRSNSIYEMQNIICKREQFYLLNNLDDIIELTNKRIFSREDTVTVVKIVIIEGGDQLTIEISLNSVNNGFFVKKSNPNKNIVFNSFDNYYSTKLTKDLLPLTKENLLKINLVETFLSL